MTFESSRAPYNKALQRTVQIVTPLYAQGKRQFALPLRLDVR